MSESIENLTTHERPKLRPRTVAAIAASVFLLTGAAKCGSGGDTNSSSGGGGENTQSTPTNLPPQSTAREGSGIEYAELLCLDGFNRKTAIFKPKDPSKPWGVEVDAYFSYKNDDHRDILVSPKGVRLGTGYYLDSHPFAKTVPISPSQLPYDVKDGKKTVMRITVASSDQLEVQCPDITKNIQSTDITVSPLPPEQIPKL